MSNVKPTTYTDICRRGLKLEFEKKKNIQNIFLFCFTYNIKYSLRNKIKNVSLFKKYIFKALFSMSNLHWLMM